MKNTINSKLLGLIVIVSIVSSLGGFYLAKLVLLIFTDFPFSRLFMGAVFQLTIAVILIFAIWLIRHKK